MFVRTKKESVPHGEFWRGTFAQNLFFLGSHNLHRPSMFFALPEP